MGLWCDNQQDRLWLWWGGVHTTTRMGWWCAQSFHYYVLVVSCATLCFPLPEWVADRVLFFLGGSGGDWGQRGHFYLVDLAGSNGRGGGRTGVEVALSSLHNNNEQKNASELYE